MDLKVSEFKDVNYIKKASEKIKGFCFRY